MLKDYDINELIKNLKTARKNLDWDMVDEVIDYMKEYTDLTDDDEDDDTYQ